MSCIHKGFHSPTDAHDSFWFDGCMQERFFLILHTCFRDRSSFQIEFDDLVYDRNIRNRNQPKGFFFLISSFFIIVQRKYVYFQVMSENPSAFFIYISHLTV